MPARFAEYPASRVATPSRDDRLLIEPSFVEGRFDSHAVDCPFVFSQDGRQGMTYVGWDALGYQTALTWNDGEGNWSPGEVVFPRDPNSELRRYNSALTSIARDNDLWSPGELRRFDGWYYGTFHAYPNAGYEAGAGSIGFVRSRDLRHWEQTGDLLRPEGGAVWERGGLYKSWLLEHDGLFYTFYNAKNRDQWPWTEQTGLAVSSDLTNWRRHADNPVLAAGGPGDFDERFASDPCVLRDGEFWVMFYFGLAADGHAREGYATSRDLVHWEKSGEILLDVGPAGSIDSLHTHKPAVISWGGRLEHYYCAVARQEPMEVSGYSLTEMRGITRAVGARPAPVQA
ncbi:hypothetical protein GCM10023322_46850 [Rugosimonospora acidiphila]|uniref:Glycosyl hydrolase family 32 N-terminal domain-containing protein n=1 Tax=Rugosimonospora acidiphila TaxID=556531 RepID=A0ABP9S4R7_9ACTN